MKNEINILEIANRTACSILVLAFSFFIGKLMGIFNFFPFTDYKVTDCLTVMVTAMTILATIHEYQSHRERIKAEVLGQYNERYSRDEHVNKVVNYIIRHMDGKVTYCLPSTHDAEMFMRFFEEMQIQIEQERLVEKQVYDLFAYYAIAFDINSEIRNNLGIIDYEKDNWNWGTFKKFTSTMFVRHFIDKTEWEVLYDNGAYKRLSFKANTICEITNKANEKTSYTYRYSSGVIMIDNKKYQYIMTGSNKPDQLQCIETNVVFKKSSSKYAYDE